MLRIHNFRAGFATNSSSSHSVILLAPPDIGNLSSIDTHDDDSYGWDYFRLTTGEEKLRYLAAQLFARYLEDKSVVANILEQIGTIEPELATRLEPALQPDADPWGSDGVPHVDHQSVFTLPDDYDPTLTSVLIKFFASPRVAVLGGNDNSDDGSAITPAGCETVGFLNHIGETNRMKTRLDGPYWTLFDSYNGQKMRFSFDRDDLRADDFVKGSAPELVDLKVTNWCTKGCTFCYMSSTKEGVHAPLDSIKHVVDMLAEMKVFEIAIGGGEPTSHPDFAAILSYINEKVIIPNFTTYSNAWLSDLKLCEVVDSTTGGIGVSCLSAKDVALALQIEQIMHATRSRLRLWNGCKITAQHVFGSVPLHVTGEFLDEAFKVCLPVLLLGYKEVGFGAAYQRHDDDNAETFIRLAVNQAQNPVLSIDTALLDRYPNLPRLLGAPDALVTSPEGKFSCYVDVVECKTARSSYVPADEMVALPTTTDSFKALFATY